MKRRWNFSLWTGFLIVLAGLGSYIPFFALFPVTRDFPWANLLLLAIGGVLVCVGLTRAFKQPEVYRGRIFGSILVVLSIAAIGLFGYGLFYEARQIPSATAAPRVGEKAPDFTLPSTAGQKVKLSDFKGKKNVVLAFYVLAFTGG